MPFRDELLARFRWIDGHADILGLLADRELLAGAVEALARPFVETRISKVAAVEARGFVLGGAIAVRLGVGFVAIRKPGSVYPGATAEQVTGPDWRGHEFALRLQRSTLGSGDVVLLLDDWAETGSQARAARALIEECGGAYAGLSLLVDQLNDETRASLAPVRAVVMANELPPSG